MIDMSNNRVPWGLLTAEEKQALREHTGGFEYWTGACWFAGVFEIDSENIHRTVPAPLVMPVYPWDDLHPDFMWCAVNADGIAWAYRGVPTQNPPVWTSYGYPYSGYRRLDAFARYVPGTVPWDQTLQQRPVKP